MRTLHDTPIKERAGRVLGLGASFILAGCTAFALSLNAYLEQFHSARLGVVLVVLLALHMLSLPRLYFGREFALYGWLFCYMLVEMLWTKDAVLALNTLIPALDFLLILLLFGGLVIFHNTEAVLLGTFCGFASAAAIYTSTSGFPFSLPAEFSYNSIAGMYLFGLFIALLSACSGRFKGLFLLASIVLMFPILATTSIKTNLGIALGIVAAGLLNMKALARFLRRYAIAIAALVGMLVFVAASNDTVVELLRPGLARVTLGVQILQAREDLPGYSSFERRSTWESKGLEGWMENPLFGHGVEAFRSKHGITSHSTPVDLLYNSGVIGFTLFYGVFASLLWRLFRARDVMKVDGPGAVILGASACYAFMTLSGTLHYNTFLAVFIAVSAALLHRYGERD